MTLSSIVEMTNRGLLIFYSITFITISKDTKHVKNYVNMSRQD